MESLAFALAILIVLVGLLDFFVGPAGDRAIKQALYKFYLAVEGGDWAALYQRPAGLVYQFINRLFGDNALSFRYIGRLALSSILVSTFLLTLVVGLGWSHFNSYGAPKPDSIEAFLSGMWQRKILFVSVFLSNVIVDVFSWTISRELLRSLSTASGKKAILLCVGALLLIKISLALSVTLWISLSHHLGPLLGRPLYPDGLPLRAYPVLFWTYFYLIGIEAYLGWAGRAVGGAGSFDVFAMTLTLQVAIPIVVFIVVSALGILGFASRPLTLRPISFLIGRIEAYPKGILTLAAVALTGILALVKAWK